MDSIDFSSVYTTILYSKVTIGVTGFVLFFILTFITLYVIRYSCTKHFAPGQLPGIVSSNRLALSLIGFISIFIGLVGGSILQSICWEAVLKCLMYESFYIRDDDF